MPDIQWIEILWYFLIYAFIGWCLEVVFCSVNTGAFVNRGFLNGPLCPIYGFGALLIILLLENVQNLLLLYLLSVLLTSALEFVAGYLLKTLFHTSWWDYSDEPFNLKGYICLKFSLAWGIACVVLMRVVHPLVSGLAGFLSGTLGLVLLAVFYGLLLADLIVTLVAVRKLNRDLGEIARIAKALHTGSDTLAQGLGNTAIGLAEKLETLELEEKTEKIREKMGETEAALQQRMTELLEKQGQVRKRLVNAFPDMKSLRNGEAMDQLRQRLLRPKLLEHFRNSKKKR